MQADPRINHMKNPLQVRFAEYLPDLPVLNNPGSVNILNVIPFINGAYLSLKEIAALSSALNARCKGAISVLDTDGSTFHYAGATTKLYEITGTGVTVTDRSSGVYTTATDEYWRFSKWGDKVIATNMSDAPQIITIGAGANFAALGGSPPKGRHIGVIKNFVVLANLDEAGTLDPTKVRWSAVENEADWTAAAGTMSDSQILFSSAQSGGGWINAFVGGEYGIIFQEYAVWRMDFIGSPDIFSFAEIKGGIGTPASNSVVKHGSKIFYLGQEGFTMLLHGTETIQIGFGKVDRFFQSDMDVNYMSDIIAAVDPEKAVVCWAYPGAGSSGGIPNKILFYNWQTQKWSLGEINCQWLFSGLGTSHTLEDLDSVSASLDALPASLDSRRWTAGNLQLTAFDTSHKLATLTGATKAATLETAEGQLYSGKKGFIHSVKPLVDGAATVTAAIKKRELQSESATEGSAMSQHSETGVCQIRNEARYQRIKVVTSGNFDFAMGVDVYCKPAGGR